MRHYTNEQTLVKITNSGSLREGTYVTRPSEIPQGATPSQVEQVLEIDPGKGAHYIDLRVSFSQLTTPPSGPTTSGGAWQRQLDRSAPIIPSKFK